MRAEVEFLSGMARGFKGRAHDVLDGHQRPVSVHVTDVAPGRLLIRGAAEDSKTLRQLLGWLESRPEVQVATCQRSTGLVKVHYQEASRFPGAFALRVRDFAFTLHQLPPKPFQVEVLHALPGRVRLHVRGLEDDDILKLAAWAATLAGVHKASASPAIHSLVVSFDPEMLNASQLMAALRTSDPSTWPAAPEPPRREWAATVFNSAVLAACVVNAAPMPVLAAGVALTSLPLAQRAFQSVAERRITVDLLDLVAVGVSLATGQVRTAALITSLLGIGDLLIERSADRARSAISRLMRLEVLYAWRLRVDGEVEQVRADRLKEGDLIVVHAGESVPADGTVVSGTAWVDEKALTGESEPRVREAGDRVLAASVVGEGSLRVRVVRAGVETTAAKILHILEGAGAKPMTLQAKVDSVANGVVLPTFGLAAATWLWTREASRPISILITDFGTGVRIVVPASALVAMTLAARQGILIKGAQYLERLAQADTIVFDKTGTLTLGVPEVVDVIPVRGWDAREVLSLSAAAELRQSHPVAEAVRRHAQTQGVEVPQPEAGLEEFVLGRGVCAQVNGRRVCVGSARWMQQQGVDVTDAGSALARSVPRDVATLWVTVDGALAGCISYVETLRPESAGVVQSLKENGRRRIVLLSGDSPSRVAEVASRLGVDEAIAELLPEDKATQVRTLRRQGRIVAMVGDGINDAPALALADVGISLRGATDVALETADVVLLRGSLDDLLLAFDAGRDTLARVHLGLGLVLVPNAVAMVLAALGWLPPVAAAVVNNGSTVVAGFAALAPLFRQARAAQREDSTTH
ncbi:cation-transporting ATPase, E1-E2 family [Myxococcus xanthus DK 1622]|uniref:P-type Zn(2+) transporter n=1 Tax=Myxococcus xanthus (strain DK1622) TaxID=246197 RepID=Q1D4H8_MYXXD|nr:MULTISPECIES: heavy metal translocating P-type ATPase [Myxococcus]ABF92362.1 cation-transporting ATPase, E1-E2 family [Myxococcus xanthus DK 1622]NOJ51175.1 heavy metal translocating P-type ATPase [Myxococcus xanthus]QPM76865.1 heavy metal translocating P-type ATPase [Myxococcus xanthus]QVW65932.1 heavy metal translocating P-type ATPase [Myxococcus xanthus DZ2]QZZ51955.1 Manganese-exporting P-type ATPase [Myxococcus xanthus]